METPFWPVMGCLDYTYTMIYIIGDGMQKNRNETSELKKSRHIFIFYKNMINKKVEI